MKVYDIFESLKEAWNNSTEDNNCFGERLKSIPWDNYLYNDTECYFILAHEMMFVTEVLDPFWEHNKKPSALFFDNDITLEFE